MPLRAVCHQKIYSKEVDGRGEKQLKERIAHIVDLHTAIDEWLDDPKVKQGDKVRLIAGGPGCGKSSFARALASDRLHKSTHDVLFIELQKLEYTGTGLESALTSQLYRFDFNADGLTGHPLEWEERKDRPLLIIFDGLDELAGETPQGERLTRGFAAAAKQLTNGPGDVRVIVLGRNFAMSEAHRDASMPDSALYHALPISPPGESDIWLSHGSVQTTGLEGSAKNSSNEVELTVSDPAGILSEDTMDLRPVYWEKWSAARPGAPKERPEGLTDNSLRDLTSDPLLLHLLIVSGDLTEERWRAVSENRNIIYRDIFNKIFDRDKQTDKPFVRGLSRQDFQILMDCLGLAAWEGGSRTGGEDDFTRIKQDYCDDEDLLEKLSNLKNTALQSVAFQFFAREQLSHPGFSQGYEFIHKSFGEFLIARALVEKAKTIGTQLIKRKEALIRWAKITSRGEITSEIMYFMRRQCMLGDNQCEDRLKIRNKLINLFSETLRDGMPVTEQDVTFRAIESNQRRSEAALIVAINAFQHRAFPADSSVRIEDRRIAPDWGRDRSALRSLFERQLLFHGVYNSPVLHCFSGFDFAPDRISRPRISMCSLLGLHAEFSNLSGASLELSNLSVARMRGTDLSRAIMHGTRLLHADFRDANLVDANLTETDLTNANLADANLTNANLSNANLMSVNLKGAQCKGIAITGANVHDADLRVVKNLTQEQIDEAVGNERTKLPPNLTRPPAWKVVNNPD